MKFRIPELLIIRNDEFLKIMKSRISKLYKSLDMNFVSINNMKRFSQKRTNFSIFGQDNPYHQSTYRSPPLHPISAPDAEIGHCFGLDHTAGEYHWHRPRCQYDSSIKHKSRHDAWHSHCRTWWKIKGKHSKVIGKYSNKSGECWAIHIENFLKKEVEKTS